MYKFFYDESEHSWKINKSTVSAHNYYDNFVTATVGWKDTDEIVVENNYLAFEEKHKERKSENELKSKTIKSANLSYGFASLKDDDLSLLTDFFDLFNENTLYYFSVTSKIEYIIRQQKNSI